MTYRNLVKILNIVQRYKKLKLPQKLCYAITRNYLSLNKEYEVYRETLKKVMDSFESYFERDDNGNPVVNSNGVPVILDEEVAKEMDAQIVELLNTEIDIDIYTVDFDMFNYDDKGIYDVLSMEDIIEVSSVLCEM